MKHADTDAKFLSKTRDYLLFDDHSKFPIYNGTPILFGTDSIYNAEDIINSKKTTQDKKHLDTSNIKNIIRRKVLPKGYAFTFNKDEMQRKSIDLLNEFYELKR